MYLRNRRSHRRLGINLSGSYFLPNLSPRSVLPLSIKPHPTKPMTFSVEKHFESYFLIWQAYRLGLRGLYAGPWLLSLLSLYRLPSSSLFNPPLPHQIYSHLGPTSLRPLSLFYASVQERLLERLPSYGPSLSSSIRYRNYITRLLLPILSYDTMTPNLTNYLIRTIHGVPSKFYFLTLDFLQHDPHSLLPSVFHILQPVHYLASLDQPSPHSHMHLILPYKYPHLLKQLQKLPIRLHIKASYTQQPWPWNVLSAASYLLKDRPRDHLLHTFCTFPLLSDPLKNPFLADSLRPSSKKPTFRI